MKPIDFVQRTHLIAKDQDEYLTLPAFVDEEQVISCWKLTLGERIWVLFSGAIWVRQFHCKKQLQPQLIEAFCPLFEIQRDAPKGPKPQAPPPPPPKKD